MKYIIPSIIIGIFLLSFVSAGLLDGIGIGGEEPITPLQKCRIEVNPNDAVEEYTFTNKIPIMEDKIVYINKTIDEITQVDKQFVNHTAMTEMNKEYWIELNNVKAININITKENALLVAQKKTPKPLLTLPVQDTTPIYMTVKMNVQTPKVIQEPKTIQVQQTETKTKYRLKQSFPFVESYQVQVKLFNTETETRTRLKSGISLDSDTGEFYKWEMKEKC